jgi:hypothetical protein
MALKDKTRNHKRVKKKMDNIRQFTTPYPAGGPVSINYNFPPSSCQHCHTSPREIRALKEKVAAIGQIPSEVNKEEFIKFKNEIKERSRAFEKHILGHLIAFGKVIDGHINSVMKEQERLDIRTAEEEDYRSLNEKVDHLFTAVEAMKQAVQELAANWKVEMVTDS